MRRAGFWLRATAMVLVGATVVWGAYLWAERFFLEQTREGARATLALYAQNLDGALRKYEAVPELLAGRGDVIQMFRNSRDPAVAARANALTSRVNRTIGAEDTYFMDADGLTFAASNWAGERSFVGKNYSFRPYFKQAMEGRLGRYFALGTVSLKRGFYFAYPVRAGAEILGAVVVKIAVDRIEAAWASGQDDVIVSDANGVVFISNRPEWRFRTLAPLSEAAVREIVDNRQYVLDDLKPLGLRAETVPGARFRLVRIDAAPPSGGRPLPVEYLVESRAIPTAGWTVHILADTRLARTQIRAAVALAVLACLIALLLATVVAQRRRRLVERFDLQKAAAERLEHRVRDRTADLRATNVRLEREIAERETTEAVLRRTQDELVQAGKMAALGRMSAALSHEFNQPLAAIRSYAENAAKLIGRGRHREARENCGRIRDLTGRMAEISKHLSAFARKPRGQVGPVDLALVIEETLLVLKGRLEAAGARVEVRVPKGLPPVLAGRVRLNQVLTNLISNALDAMTDAPSPAIGISAETCARGVRLSIHDHGSGIAEDILPRLFDPFVTTKRVGEGLGLGLSISYNIVQDFNGALSAHNHADGGAVFVIELPVVSGADAEGAAARSETADADAAE